MIDIEEAILYVDASKRVADITGMLIIVKFEWECLYCLPLLSLMVIHLIYLEM